MLAHFMLFSEADIEYRFLMATNNMIKEESVTQLTDSESNTFKSAISRFHKINLQVVNAKNRNKKDKN